MKKMSIDEFRTGIQMINSMQSMESKGITDDEFLKWFRSLPVEVKQALVELFLFIDGKTKTGQAR